MSPSPYDDGWLLDNLATEMQLNHSVSIVDPKPTTTCGGCGSQLLSVDHDAQGREVRDFACGHRYTIGQRTVSIERV